MFLSLHICILQLCCWRIICCSMHINEFKETFNILGPGFFATSVNTVISKGGSYPGITRAVEPCLPHRVTGVRERKLVLFTLVHFTTAGRVEKSSTNCKLYPAKLFLIKTDACWLLNECLSSFVDENGVKNKAYNSKRDRAKNLCHINPSG